MGIATPFPEPDSEELRRNAVRSLPEVCELLCTIHERAVRLNVFLDAGSAFEVVQLLGVDEAGGTLLLESPADDVARHRLLAAPRLTLVGFVDAVKVQFSVSGVAAASHAGRPALTTSIPAQLIRLQRRAAVRVGPEAVRGAVCRVPLGGEAGEHEVLQVLDISTGGLAVLTYPERFEPVVGAEVNDCRLDLPGVGGTVVSLRVRHIGRRPVDDEARFCGCEFVSMAPAVRSMVERYVARCEGSMRSCRSADPPVKS